MNAIVTVLGKDKPGIISKVSTALAENNINIEDISQTIIQDNFTMIMLCNFDKCKKQLTEVADDLDNIGKKIGVNIRVQHEDIFNVMHKI